MNTKLKASEKEMEQATLSGQGRTTMYGWEKLSVGEKLEFPYKSTDEKDRIKQMRTINYSSCYFSRNRKVKITLMEGKITGDKLGIIAVRVK